MAALVWTSAAQAQGQWQGRQVAGMAVQVYTPAAGQPGQRPLLIALHGCAQSAQAMQQRAGLERAAEIHAAIVATPSVPNGGVILGCWDYYGANHSRRTRHVAPLLALVDALLADEALGIAPERVWIAGLSSGGGQAAVMGCVAPDVFAGVGVAAGPAVGTSSGEIGRVATDVAQATADCRRMAGGFAAAFDTQLFAVVAGSNDFTVAQDYARVQAEMAAALYGAGDAAPRPIEEVPGAGVQGRYTVWSDAEGPRVARIQATGLGHAWPAGSGQGQELEFVAQQGPDFGRFLADFFILNDRRSAGAIQLPQVLWISAAADPQAGAVEVTGRLSEAAVSATVLLLADDAVVDQALVQPRPGGDFSVVFADVPRGQVLVPAAVAEGADGLLSDRVDGAPVVVRDPAQDAPPQVRLDEVQVGAGCVDAAGTSGDPEDGAPQVALQARLEGELVTSPAQVGPAGAWTGRLCGLAAGCWTVFAVATDTAGQSARSVPTVVGVGDGGAVDVVEADLNGHLMRYGTYALGYGTPDITYVDLLNRYGLNEVFPLYLGVDGLWYHDPANLPGAEPPDCDEPPPEPDQGVEPDLGGADLGPDEGPPVPDEGVFDAALRDAALQDAAADAGQPDAQVPPADQGAAADAQALADGAPDRGAPALDQGPRPDQAPSPPDEQGDIVIDCRQGPIAPTWWGLLALGALIRRRRRP